MKTLAFMREMRWDGAEMQFHHIQTIQVGLLLFFL
jgi:hypothetical protein